MWTLFHIHTYFYFFTCIFALVTITFLLPYLPYKLSRVLFIYTFHLSTLYLHTY